ncbi:MAG: hypothetical protein OXL37_09735 [Chloroflexota bacterium]|nr:hypothetical protein [Chloroflexota bacterium]MDE2960670.1 hypothetical protein [Chloroflexota bacterium]
MWQNIKYYALALAVILIGASTSTALQLLQAYLPIGHPLGALAANLSGVTIGTIIMVIGFLKDNRLDQERKRADNAIAEAAVATAKAAAAEVVIQQERERADRYLAELERFRESYERTTEALIQLLRERNGNHPPNPDPTE